MAAAYTDVDGRDVGTLLSGELGGLTIGPWLYHTGAAATITTTLTLDGGPDDIYIFQINGALTMAASIEVVLSNGASAIFPGIVLSNAAITPSGRALWSMAGFSLRRSTLSRPVLQFLSRRPDINSGCLSQDSFIEPGNHRTVTY